MRWSPAATSHDNIRGMGPRVRGDDTGYAARAWQTSHRSSLRYRASRLARDNSGDVGTVVACAAGNPVSFEVATRYVCSTASPPSHVVPANAGTQNHREQFEAGRSLHLPPH